MKLLRFFTAGNVDDGKSTLIGRLLYDSNSISADIIEALSRQSKTKTTDSGLDLALLTDGLRAEREQGITIDVAYKYFTTPKRKFIIADTPGHVQYTRNMFTGASNTDLAIILIDARHGISEQTKRHSIICAILKLAHVVVCINKMDLIDYDNKVYEQIKADYMVFADKIGLGQIDFIPISALGGDNVVHRSDNMDWYQGPALLNFLENLEVQQSVEQQSARFQVQYVIRPQTSDLPDYRGFAGKILGGMYQKGQSVMVLPSKISSIIQKIEINGAQVEVAQSGQAVVLHLQDNLDICRGDAIVALENLPNLDTEVFATICWMSNEAFEPSQKLLLQQNSFITKALIKDVFCKIDIHSFEQLQNQTSIGLNDICKVMIKTAQPLSFDSFEQNKQTGAFILINQNTNQTVAAGTIHNKID